MIVTTLDRIAAQADMTPAMQKALDFLVASQGKELEDGRVEIDGDTVFALVQSYDSKESADVFFEGHKRYIDFQYVAAGQEALGWAPVDAATITREYDEGRDMWLGTVPAEVATFVYMPAGQLAVLWPSDAHAPMRAAGGVSSPVKKIVVKVSVGS